MLKYIGAKDFNISKYRHVCLLLMLLFPLFFANMGRSHDWGDDFAQYIHQGINITENIAQSQTGYVFNPENPMVGPITYPVGFPLLISGVSYFSGNYIGSYIFFMTVVLVAFALLLYVFFRKQFTWHTALLMVLIFVYNPLVLNFKREVMADLPFALFLLAGVMVYRWPRVMFNSILTGLVAGFLICLKGIGWTFVLAVIVTSIYEFLKSDVKKYNFGTIYRHFNHTVIISVTAVFVWFVVEKLVFNVSSGYAVNFIQNNVLLTIFKNLSYYQEVGMSFLTTNHDYTGFIGVFAGAGALVCVMLGIIKRFAQPVFEDWIFAVFMMVLLVYPYQGSGFRFLLPLIPLLLLYGSTGFGLMLKSVTTRTRAATIICSLLIIFQYLPGVFRNFEINGNEIAGPQESASVNAFCYLDHKLPNGTIVAFCKPRALALYSQCRGFAVGSEQKIYEIDKQFKDFKIDYFLLNNNLDDKNLERWLKVRADRVEKVWENSRFELYRRVK